ncbi:NYN domain-containing protein [Methylobacterium sp. GC_Met_2]|uniref:NYN domain-containing protein n=1 Tax=Methylobacterium sp. GC_Met_2 TaxID=2937376 RepID=UPI00226B4060|nr:NYN domain-containing protein [Methylobacterium sp. GC_Met_2]
MIINARTAPVEREYLFIDGGCLRAAVSKISKDIFGNDEAYKPLLKSFATPDFHKIYYYDAIPGRNHNEAQAAYEARIQPEFERIEKIQMLDRVHVALGQIVGANRRQKGVDVRLAVDMMTQAFRGNITRATLFAGDADFVPLIEALVAEGLHVTLWHPPQANGQLKRAADSTRLFSFRSDLKCFASDDESPAFFLNPPGGQSEPPPDAHVVFLGDGRKIAGRWRGNSLVIWVHSGSFFWNTYHLAAPDCTLQAALRAFDALVNLGIADTAEQWIQT